MKKIVSAVAVAALAASFASAEVKTSLSARLGPNLFSHTMRGSTEWFDLDQSSVGADGFTFAASGENAGAKLNYNPKITEGGKDWSEGKMKEFSFWLKPASFLTVNFGCYGDGVFTAEQCKSITDATNLSAAGKYAFLYKPGVSTKNSTGYFLDSLVDIQNDGALAAYADLDFAGVGSDDAKLKIRLAATETSTVWATEENDAGKEVGTTDNKAYVAPGAMVSYQMGETFKANLDFQMVTDHDMALGFYFSPMADLIGKETKMMVGYTFSTNTSDLKDANKQYGKGKFGVSYNAIDFRVENKSVENLTIVDAFNYTMGSEDYAVTCANGSKKDSNSKIWDALFVDYRINSNWRAGADLQIDYALGVKKGNDDVNVLDVYATPYVMYSVGNAAITFALNITSFDFTAELADDSTTTISMPIICRVKL